MCMCDWDAFDLDLLGVYLKAALWAADDNDGGDIHYVRSVVTEYRSCAYMDSCRVLPSFQGRITPLVFQGALCWKDIFMPFSIRFIMFMFYNIFHGFLGSTCKL